MLSRLVVYFLCFNLLAATVKGQAVSCADTSGRYYLNNDSLIFYANDPTATPGGIFAEGIFNFNRFPFDGGSFVAKLDYNANPVWNKLYKELNLTQVLELKDGNLILLGNEYDGTAVYSNLTKTDASGNVIWNKYYKTKASNDPGNFALSRITQDATTGDLYIQGTSSFYNVCVAKLDAASGNIFWSKAYRNPLYFLRPVGMDIQQGVARLFAYSVSFGSNVSSVINIIDIDKSTGDTIKTTSFKDEAATVDFYGVEPLVVLNNGHYIFSGACFNSVWDGVTPLSQAALVEFDNKLQFVRAYSLKNNLEPVDANAKNRINVYPDGNGCFSMLHDLSGYTEDLYCVDFKEGAIQRQRRSRYLGKGVTDHAPASVQVPGGGDMLIRLLGDSLNHYFLEALKLQPSDTASECLGEEDNATTVFNFNYVNAPYSYDTVLSDVLQITNAGQVTVVDSPMNRITLCVQAPHKPISLNLGPDTTVCSNNNLLLYAHTGYKIYRWQDGTADSTYTVTGSGQYYVAVTDNCGNTTSDTINILYKPQPIVNLGNDTALCEGTVKQLDAANSNATYLWQDGSINATYTVNAEGLYFVTVNSNGCKASDSIFINYITKPVVSLGNDTSICKGQQVLLMPFVNTKVDYLWQDGSTGATFTASATGPYKVYASNTCGSDSSALIIKDGVCGLYMPSAFTPGKNGQNNLFRVKYPFAVTGFSFTIYNRWGQQLFASNDIYKGWDGTYNGAEQNEGTYVWMMSFIDTNGQKKFTKGTVLLIR